MKIEYVPFTDNMLPTAADLLAARHARHRQAQPLLPKRFEDLASAAKAVAGVWHKKWSKGFAAVRNGRLVAYLIGETLTQPWGRSGYVYLPGYALAEIRKARPSCRIYTPAWAMNGSGKAASTIICMSPPRIGRSCKPCLIWALARNASRPCWICRLCPFRRLWNQRALRFVKPTPATMR